MSEQRSLSRRGFLTAFGAGAAAAGLTACVGPGTTRGGHGSTGGTLTMPDQVGTGPAKGKLSFAHWRAEDKAAFATLIDKFKKANPDASITQDIAPSADYQATELQRIKSGAVGDVFAAFRGSQFTAIAKAGLFLPLGKQSFIDNYVARLVRAGRSDGIEMGMPYQLVFPMPLYNVDLFDKAGISEIPQDWDGFLSLCDKLKGKGYYPMAWPGGEIGNAGQLFNSMVMNNAPTDDACARIENGQGKCTDDWFVNTLKQYKQLIPYFQPNSVGTQPQPCQQLFKQEKAAMLVTGSYDIAAVRKLGAKFPLDLLSPITTTKDKAKYQGTYNATFILGVSSASKQQDAGLKFLEFLSQPENAQFYGNETAQLTTVENVQYSNKDLAKTAKWITRRTSLAMRYQFENLDVEHAVEGACIKVVGGTSPENAAESAQRVVDQNR